MGRFDWELSGPMQILLKRFCSSSVGEDKASCMTGMSLADLVAARENVLSQYFQTFLEYTQGLPDLVKITAGSSGI